MKLNPQHPKHSHSSLYLLVLFLQYEWKGQEAAFYQSFDGSDGLSLIEGYDQINLVPLVSGKIRNEEKFTRKLRYYATTHSGLVEVLLMVEVKIVLRIFSLVTNFHFKSLYLVLEEQWHFYRFR